MKDYSFCRANSFRDRENRNNQYDDSDLVFQRVDPPLGDFSNMFDEGAQGNEPNYSQLDDTYFEIRGGGGKNTI